LIARRAISDNDHIDAVDEEQDHVAWGVSVPQVEADAIDVVAEDCETVDLSTQ